ncbi:MULTISPECIES: hypothetical protein [Aeromonas]|jgi:hypothetical protein|uniref:hypothetical protein n=1 Tax=Aeromonas TaxID=642 RepID=UPI0009564F6A|nr:MULTISPECIES: hypothetical protein [Aeromonas]ELM3719944.1 hypothetical protein [Aeromonas hydrophila]MBC6488401.1 hypothetical protein [Aeromonas hydrophila]MBF4798921.1 hypothetical protein [Aeromonas hydrophila]MBL0570968.1 hypothetical protein [Aeromonas hydrophila]MBO0407349.1 hypothetical protein [Aeromonas hydrophila]
MQILLIEDDTMLSMALCQGLSQQDIASSQLTHCKEIASLPTLLRQQPFDAIICRQNHHQGQEGIRMLQEAHYLGLLEPGCVLLLLDADLDLQQYPPSDLYFPLQLAIPFTADQLTAILRELVLLTGLTRALPAPMRLREWQVSCALCEDLLYQQQKYRELGPLLDRIKGYMLLQQQNYFHAAQHYAVCTTEHDAWWPRKGLIHALLGLGKLESARKDLARNRERLPPALQLELALACLLHERQWEGAWDVLNQLLQRQAWLPEWRQAAILLALLLKDEGKALEQANALSLRFFSGHKFRVSIDNFILNASLAVLWHYPSAARISALQQEHRYLSQAVTLLAHEEALLRALMLSLDYRFDEALLLLAKHPPETARDNHLNQLLGFAVSQFCGLPHHAQRYLSQLSQYQARVAPAPQIQQLFKQVVSDFMKQLERRELRLTYLRQERQRASAAGQHQLAVQYALTLQEEFPALPGDAWQLLELLQLCWPAGMAAPRVALLVDRLERRLNHSASFMEHHAEEYRKTLQQIRTHLTPKLPPTPHGQA